MPEVRPPDGDPASGAPLTRRQARELAARREAEQAAARGAQTAAAREPAAAPEPAPWTPPAAEPRAVSVPEPRTASVPEPAAVADPAPTARIDAQPSTERGYGPMRTGSLLAMDEETPADVPVAAAASPRPSQDADRGPSMPVLDDLFTGTTTTDSLGAVPAKKSKRQKRKGCLIGFLIVIVVLGGIGAGGLYVWHTYEPQIRSLMGWEEPKDYEAGLAHGEALITIESGDTGAVISKTLSDAGVTKTSGAFYDLLVSTGANPTFYPGVYKLQKQMTAKAALKALLDPASKQENAALLPEGLTEDQILDRLSDSLGIPRKDFTAAVKNPSDYGVDADSLEGWLFPAMYDFNPDVTAKDVIKTMVARTVTSLDDAGVPEADRQRILIIASIIQREAREEKDFYKVSRVIENRLDPDNQETFGKLQMDSTAQYGYGELHDGTASSSQAALDDDNPWNTYVHAGLPVGPISNPGDVAIDAAMHPAKGPWLYFVTVNMDTGETVFSTTYAEHEKAITQMRAWCTDHPDAGC
ncbi:endolytic transglycosylase MltG [Microbacterium sp. KR10-403]|uniref:endolytic transglycosylase MltG n=1 Tax=Microbacterium sp. KR10-403 TaxID=3158581 RepID=UPI0032E37A8C